ncbi:Nucleotide-sugar transporter family protein [Quillaja saponaria]|uniref:Nucleotide-sugar transporter family protein n=1 Tax=Quillaja saponaria TaxID=32244 RepID=A0AAD7PQE7_QUISA|nr:Nucleotide-sugar transporter family protein [Quillaja saponaria]
MSASNLYSINHKPSSFPSSMAPIVLISPATLLVPLTGGVVTKQRNNCNSCTRERYSNSSSIICYSLVTKFRTSQLGYEYSNWSREIMNRYGGGGGGVGVGLAKVSEGGALPLYHTWPTPDDKVSYQDPPSKMKGSSRFFTIGLVASCYVAIAWMKMVPMQTIRSRVQFLKIAALSFVFCISVVFGNISLRFLPVSFNQAIGATTPFFTAVFAYLMTFKREAWLTYVTLVPVVTGVIIASGGEPSFHLFGFIMCIAATAARALKSVLQGILLSSEGEKLNSMNLLLYMAPIAVVFLLPATLIMEDNVVGITLALARDDIKIIWYLLFNSALAYFVNLTNFLVTKHTSALTLQVLGNAKGAVAVVVSILIFRNPVSVTGMLGYTLTVFGVILYSEAKKRSK